MEMADLEQKLIPRALVPFSECAEAFFAIINFKKQLSEPEL